MTVMAPPIFSYANHDGDQRCETLLRRQSARRDPVSPFPAVFFLCNSAVAALSLVLEIFSGEVAAGIPGLLLRFLHDDVSNNAQQRRLTMAAILAVLLQIRAEDRIFFQETVVSFPRDCRRPDVC
ncbi:hypothetical protein MRB53_033857 [Persea americana]|uniref:Uncharacterized protein n=1 Tax=Persea americana TaxID=3435 RepID=A0ACC2KW69_PERAE|nr:hypothetical protein MRB53_033857 [Persea americana]